MLKFEFPQPVSPKSRAPLVYKGNVLECSKTGERYPIYDGIPDLFVDYSDDYKVIESKAQDEIAERYEDLMRMHSYRNEFIHSHFYQYFEEFSVGTCLLELGCGTGMDGRNLMKRGYQLVETDISFESLKLAKREAERLNLEERCQFYRCDAGNIPFAGETFNVVFSVAVLHHMRDTQAALEEMKRCTRRGGMIILAIEPNSWYYRVVRPIGKLVEKFWFFIHHRKDTATHSIAEATTRGFTKRHLVRLARSTGLEIVNITPLWLFAGAFHIFSQALERILGIRLPDSERFDKLLIRVDSVCLRIPFLSGLCWHYTTVLRKPAESISQKGIAKL